jgi:hypothetical protein
VILAAADAERLKGMYCMCSQPSRAVPERGARSHRRKTKVKLSSLRPTPLFRPNTVHPLCLLCEKSDKLALPPLPFLCTKRHESQMNRNEKKETACRRSDRPEGRESYFASEPSLPILYTLYSAKSFKKTNRKRESISCCKKHRNVTPLGVKSTGYIHPRLRLTLVVLLHSAKQRGEGGTHTHTLLL